MTLKRSNALLLAVSLIASIEGSVLANSPAQGASHQTHSANPERQRAIIILRGHRSTSLPRDTSRAVLRRAIVADMRRTATRAQRELTSVLQAAPGVEFEPVWFGNAIGVRAPKAFLEQIRKRSDVSDVIPDEVVHVSSPPGPTMAVDSSPSPDSSWNIERIGANQAWEAGIDGAGTVVANIDTGVQADHPSLSASYRGADGDNNYDWLDLVGRESTPYDDSWHGTATMGLMVGGDGLGPDPNDIGVAPGARWIAVKAFNSRGSGYLFDIWRAFQWIAAPTRLDRSDPRPELAPDVVSLSFSGGQCLQSFDGLLSGLRELHIFPAVSAGNKGPNKGTVSHPGESPYAFTVGATTPDDSVAEFSSRGPTCRGDIKPNIAAPGVYVRTAWRYGGFNFPDGTSFSTPQVAGAAALVKEASASTITVDQIEAILESTALDLGTPGPDNAFGAGLLQVNPAVQAVRDGGLVTGMVRAHAGASLGNAEVQATSSESRRYTTTRADGSFLLRLPQGTWTFTASKFGYEPGTASATSVPGQTTSVEVEVAGRPQASISGRVQDETGKSVAEATISFVDVPRSIIADTDGRFSTSLPLGTYEMHVERNGCLSQSTEQIDVSENIVHNVELRRSVDSAGFGCEQDAGLYDTASDKVIGFQPPDPTVRVDLPFSFQFYGIGYSEAWISESGCVSFSGACPTPIRPVPSAGAPRAAIFPWWKDLQVGGPGGGVFTSTFGDAPNRRFVIEYRWMRDLDSGQYVRFEVVLHEDGTFDLGYRDVLVGARGAWALIGFQDQEGLNAFQYSYNKPTLPVGDSRLRFAPEPDYGVVAGGVMSAVDGLPIPRATVGSMNRTAIADSMGRYRLGVPAGQRTVTFEGKGYEPQTDSVSLAAGEVITRDKSLRAPRAEASPDSLSLSTASPETTVTVHSTGLLPLHTEYQEISDGMTLVGDDPVGDAFGNVDIVRVQTSATAQRLRISVEFTPSTQIDTIVLEAYLDTDRDPATGASWRDGLTDDIGFEYSVTAVAPRGSASIRDANDDVVVVWEPVTIEEHTMSFDVPLAPLHMEDTVANVVFITGGNEDLTPNTGYFVVGGSSEVPWLDVAPTRSATQPDESSAFTVHADTSTVGPGDYQAILRLAWDDPRHSAKLIPVSLHVEPRPDTFIRSAPPRRNSATVSFTFDSDHPDVSFECSLDGSGFAPCSSPSQYDGLTEGSHSFAVRARSSDGRKDESPATVTWAVDLTTPTLVLTSGPEGFVSSTAGEFHFTSDDPSASFHCHLDNQEPLWEPCTSPKTYTSLAEGSHTFTVYARDDAGNPTVPISRSWTVDTVPPKVVIEDGPEDVESRRTATFAFSSNEPANYMCALDHGGEAPCESPYAYQDLPIGDHLFTVVATDPAGNRSLPASASWRIDADVTPPSSTIATKPGSLVLGSAGRTIEGLSADDGAGVAVVLVTYVNNLTGDTTSHSAVLSCSKNRRACTWESRPPSIPGQYRVHVIGTDLDGNEEIPGPSQFNIIV